MDELGRRGGVNSADSVNDGAVAGEERRTLRKHGYTSQVRWVGRLLVPQGELAVAEESTHYTRHDQPESLIEDINHELDAS